MIRRLTGAVAALSVFSTIALGVGASSSPVHAQGVSDPGDTGLVDLIEQTTWIAPDGDVVLQIDVSDAPRDATLTVTFHDRLAGRFELASSIDGTDVGSTLRTIVDQPVAELDPDGNGRVEVRLGLRGGSGDR